MQGLCGYGLVAGKGVRLQPLTLKANGYLRSKATVRFLGERIITWLLRSLRSQGLDDMLMITRGKENRGQVKSIVQYGEALGMQVRYSPMALEAIDTGSAGAVLDNLQYQSSSPDTLFVFPTDSLLEFDLPAMLEHHRRTGAAVTIAAAEFPAEEIADKYGLLDTEAGGRVRHFLEKPSLKEIFALRNYSRQSGRPLPALPTNAGFYLMDAGVMREISRHPAIQRRQHAMLDIGGNLLPWLVDNNYTVQSFPVRRMGDLGNIPSFLQTMFAALAGEFPSLMPLLTTAPDVPAGMFIDPTSWEMKDLLSGLSLREKVARGLVTLHAPLRIGKFVRIDPGATISQSNIDDECHIQEGATVIRSSVGDGSLIGPYSQLTEVITGMMAHLRSTREQPVSLADYTAIGDEVMVDAGADISGRVCIYPRLSVPAGIQVHEPVDITSQDTLAVLARSGRNAPAPAHADDTDTPAGSEELPLPLIVPSRVRAFNANSMSAYSIHSGG